MSNSGFRECSWPLYSDCRPSGWLENLIRIWILGLSLRILLDYRTGKLQHIPQGSMLYTGWSVSGIKLEKRLFLSPPTTTRSQPPDLGQRVGPHFAFIVHLRAGLLNRRLSVLATTKGSETPRLLLTWVPLFSVNQLSIPEWNGILEVAKSYPQRTYPSPAPKKPRVRTASYAKPNPHKMGRSLLSQGRAAPASAHLGSRDFPCFTGRPRNPPEKASRHPVTITRRRIGGDMTEVTKARGDDGSLSWDSLQ